MRMGFVYRRALRFAETDMAGVGHFSAVLTLIEEAWHAWLLEMGQSPHPSAAPPGAEGVGWPVVSVSCDFAKPLHFNEEVAVTLVVERLGPRSVRMRFTLEGAAGESAAGHFAVACAVPDDSGGWVPRQVPERLNTAISG